MASATSTSTRTARARPRRKRLNPARPVDADARSASIVRCGRAYAIAGSTPTSAPARSDAKATNSSTDTSSDTSSSRGKPGSVPRSIRAIVVASARSARSPTNATRMPAAPDITASNTLSAASCRARRTRPAPSAVRTAISRRRSFIRASTRFPTLTHAISSTNSDAPSSISSAGLIGSTTPSSTDSSS